MKKKIAIIDYESGNIFSVKQAVSYVGAQAVITSDHDEIMSADAIILPGVGAFAPAIQRLKDSGLDEVIVDAVANKGKAILGICLGMQLLFDESEEFGRHKGLGLIQGDVVKFSGLNDGAKIPQTQWNEILLNEKSSTLFKGIDTNPFMYFVHSYYVRPQSESLNVFNAEYMGLEYCCAFEHENIFAVQFHPERSAKDGLQLIANFCEQA